MTMNLTPAPEPERPWSSPRSERPNRSVLDLTRNIQRKKEKELAALQLVGGDGIAARRRAASNPYKKVGPQRSLSLRQRKEVQEMPRGLITALAICSNYSSVAA